MKRLIIIPFFLCINLFLYAQECSNYPAYCPETGFIEQSQSSASRLCNDILQQEIDMQDKMRTIFTSMMKDAAKNHHWNMVELSEYTNENGMQVSGTPYELRSPRGIDITFQFIVSNDSLQAWKNFQREYNKTHSNDVMQDYNNLIATTESPLYKQYKDSVDYYMNMYSTYVEQHKDEGADLFTKDKNPAYYQKKQTEFLDKMNSLTNQTHQNAGIESKVTEHDLITRRFRNNTVVQIEFHVNTFVAIAINQSLGPIESTSTVYPLSNTNLAKLYTIKKDQDNPYLFKWTHSILILLGNFNTIPRDEYVYSSGFNQTPQGDERSAKKIKSDKVQCISIVINGNETNIKNLAKLIDINKLNGTIVKS